MDFELRKLCFDDVFSMTTILNKIGFMEFKDCFTGVDVQALIRKNGKDVEKVGASIFFNVAGVLLKNANACKKELYSFMGSMANISPNDVANLSPVKAYELILAIIKLDEFKDFFTVVLKSLGMGK